MSSGSFTNKLSMWRLSYVLILAVLQCVSALSFWSGTFTTYPTKGASRMLNEANGRLDVYTDREMIEEQKDLLWRHWVSYLSQHGYRSDLHTIPTLAKSTQMLDNYIPTLAKSTQMLDNYIPTLAKSTQMLDNYIPTLAKSTQIVDIYGWRRKGKRSDSLFWNDANFGKDVIDSAATETKYNDANSETTFGGNYYWSPENADTDNMQAKQMPGQIFKKKEKRMKILDLGYSSRIGTGSKLARSKVSKGLFGLYGPGK